MADPYANVIWVDSIYWLWTWVAISAALFGLLKWADRGHNYGPADELADNFISSVSAGVIAAIIVFGATMILKLFGLEIGMSS